MSKTLIEELEISGDALLAKIKGLIHEGNIRRIIIKNEEGQEIIEIPLTLGVVGAALMPVLAAVGALAALAVKWKITLVKEEEEETIETPAASE